MFDTGTGTFTSDLAAVLAAIALLLVPPLLGAAIAAGLRRLGLAARRHRVVAALVLSALPVALALWKIRQLDAVGFWDLLGPALGFAAGVALGMVVSPQGVRRKGPFVLGGTLVGLALLEGIARVALPAAWSVPPSGMARWSVPISNRDPPCNLVFAPRDAVLTTLGPPGPTVLHVGDSLVAGVGVGAGETFVDDLASDQPEVRHVNLGAAGAGPEAYLLTLTRWTAPRPARLAVVYLFVGNDIEDLGAPSLCCGGASLVRLVGDHLEPRCPAPRWSIPVAQHAVTSPAPFALRALASYSRVAGALLSLTVNVQQSLSRHGVGAPTNRLSGHAAAWEPLVIVLRSLRAAAEAHHTPLLLVALPSRATLERSLGREPAGRDYWGGLTQGREAQQRVVDLTRAAGIDVVDAWEPVRAALAREGSEAMFAREYPGDIHFSARGHRVVADWLLGELQARGVR